MDLEGVVGQLAAAVQSEEDERKGYTVAIGLVRIAHALQNLGNGDAATPMGAIEALGLVFKEGFQGLNGALDGGLQELGSSVYSGLAELADAVKGHTEAVHYLAVQVAELRAVHVCVEQADE